MKLLIADDELLIRKGLESLKWDVSGIKSVRVVQDGREAIECLRTYAPDIILLDINMPNFSGIDLARYVSENNLDCKLIFLSGYNDFQYAHSAIVYGVFDYILKPSAPEELLDCVSRAVAALKEERTQHVSIESMREELRTRPIATNFFTGNYTQEEGAGSGELIQRIFTYMETNYMNNISLKTLTQELHFSSIYLCRILKRQTGNTFLEILTSIRMLHAANLLVNTDQKIFEIAEHVGISDQKYLSQIFKKTFGLTPMKYRKHAGQKELRLSDLLNKGTQV